MTTHKWKRCQECGIEAVQEGERVSCPACDDPWMDSGRWDADQNILRARKRFELVKAAVSGLTIDAWDKPTRNYREGLVEDVDSLLVKLYGQVPEPEVGSG